MPKIHPRGVLWQSGRLHNKLFLLDLFLLLFIQYYCIIKRMQISNTSTKILAILVENQNKDYYINELVRETRLFPNAVFQALKTLAKQKILSSYRSGQRRFFHLNREYKNLQILKEIVNSNKTTSFKESRFNWVKVLNRETSHSFTTALCIANTNHLKKIYGVTVPAFWLNNITHGVYYMKDDLILLGKTISERIETDPYFAKKDIDLCYKTCKRLLEVSKKIPLINLSYKTDRQLADILKNFYNHYLDVFPFVTSPHAIERYFETRIKQEVEENDILEVLFSPVATTDEERDNALKIADYVKKNGFDKKGKKLIEKHWEKFCWIPLWSINAQPLTIEYFEDEIKNILDKIKDPIKELIRLKTEEIKSRVRLKKAFKKIKAKKTLIDQVHYLQKYIHLRIFRKNTISQAHYYLLPLLNEAANSLKIAPNEVKLLSFDEIILGLVNKNSQTKIKKMVKNRKEDWAILMVNGKITTICGVKEIIETMEQFQIIAPTSAMQRLVKGRVACRGKVIGRVKIINKLSELAKVEKGDILVAKMTTPDYMVGIHKAAAIVTDEGGVTCHAAIVAREFNIPCITATSNATQILSDNDLVEVDAVEGIVRVVETIETPENIKVINGKTIYKGKVKGPARIVLDASDFEKVKHGDILIAPQITPEYLSCLYRAKGFIVDEDSLTSHASLCGRALKLPSIMGTNFARNIFKDGDLIGLDASHGVVKLIKKN